jgi:Tfp pilus assembly protein FimT
MFGLSLLEWFMVVCGVLAIFALIAAAVFWKYPPK